MDKYTWNLKNGDRAKISCSANFDNQISKFKGRECIGGVSLMDCGIVGRMPYIMRYCFEEDVDLRKRSFLKNLLDMGQVCDFDERRILSDLQRPLRRDIGLIRNIEKKLVLYSTPCIGRGESISFNSEDVAQFVEGCIKVLDTRGLKGAYIKTIQTVKYYHECLDNGLLGTK